MGGLPHPLNFLASPRTLHWRSKFWKHSQTIFVVNWMGNALQQPSSKYLFLGTHGYDYGVGCNAKSISVWRWFLLKSPTRPSTLDVWGKKVCVSCVSVRACEVWNFHLHQILQAKVRHIPWRKFSVIPIRSTKSKDRDSEAAISSLGKTLSARQVTWYEAHNILPLINRSAQKKYDHPATSDFAVWVFSLLSGKQISSLWILQKLCLFLPTRVIRVRKTRDRRRFPDNLLEC